MIKCSNCGAQLDDDALFCTECGTKQEPQKNTCPHCGAEIDDDSIFCAECGTKLDAVTTPTVEQPQEEPVLEKTVVEQQPTTENANDANFLTADINPVSNTNGNSLKYIISGLVCAALIVVGGWFVYDRFFGSMIDKLELVKPLKYVVVAVPTAISYTEPNEKAPEAKAHDGSDLVFTEYQLLAVVEDCGEWYKVVHPDDDYQDAFVKKSMVSDTDMVNPISDMYATYLTIDCPDFGSCYIVHRSDGKQLVLRHKITIDGEEILYLGQLHEGVYVFSYCTKIDHQYWSEYRKTIRIDNGSMSFIDFNQIPEKLLTDPFKENIRSHKRCLKINAMNHVEFFRLRKINISTIDSFYKADHPYLEGNIAGKYDFVMFLDVFGDRVEGRYRVLQNKDGFVNLSGSITMGKVEVYEYNKDGSQTGYYFSGTLNDKGFSGKYLSTEKKKLKMSFTSKVK